MHVFVLVWFLFNVHFRLIIASIYPVSTDLCAYSAFMMYYHSLLCTAGIQLIYLKQEGSLSWLLLHG